MPVDNIERPDWGDGAKIQFDTDAAGNALRVLTEVPLGSAWPDPSSAVISPEEGQQIVDAAEAVGNSGGEVSEHLETFGPIAATLCSELPEADLDAVCDEFDALPQETREWVESIVTANPHANLKRIAKLLTDKATLQHAAAMRAVGW